MADSIASPAATDAFIIVSGIIGILFAIFQFKMVSRISLTGAPGGGHQETLVSGVNIDTSKLIGIYEAIREGADSFLKAEYTICAYFIVAFGIVVLLCASYTGGEFHIEEGGLTAVSFVAGGVTSIVSGLIGMKVAVFSNARTTVMAAGPNAWTDAFNTAFRAGSVMGFALVGLSMLVLYILAHFFTLYFTEWDTQGSGEALKLTECLAGYGLGGSAIALFGRVGGGIYTKAADVGADLAGKVVEDIPEDDPRNPATIADNVGDNVGDVAGMGSDLFGSFAEATCAALVVASNSETLIESGGWSGLMFPVTISAGGIIVCMLCSFMATNIMPVKHEADIETVLKVQLGLTTLVLTPVIYALAALFLPSSFYLSRVSDATIALKFTPVKAWACVISGLWSGCLIGFITEYYTSHSYAPVREVAQSCETGAATNIIYGLALGYRSAILPVSLLAIVVYISFWLGDMYGVALAALGMLANLATCLAIDVYGPICDNAGGIAEMSELPENVRDVTDALDAAGNTTAAIGKGFAIGSACLVGLALFGAFVTRSGLNAASVSLVSPLIFASLIFGAMIPYWFSAMTMKSVGKAANEMVKEVARQFREIPGLLEGTPGHAPPDHARCIAISTDASLREMVPPAILVMTTPLLFGIFLGVDSVAGMLAGAIVSSIQMAISSSNTGGAWDNAKKYVEKGKLSVDGVVQGKGSEIHKAAVVGDTVGDPLKDTSGPALNIVMKLMAILALVFADFFGSINSGRGLFDLPR
ncbi:V-type H(+)-translocating pyrophosphatase [bacterium]|nr:V-type H(+)-translocating pyrophosphatase [bacterium]|tara:strand:- start:17528 stop:19804 length:2277 start_codon:yes stop_codon:yes gene_type:complete